MAPARDDFSIENEPQFRPTRPQPDPSEARAEQVLARQSRDQLPDEAVEHTVWDEPALSPELTAAHDGPQLSYAEWLAWRLQTTPVSSTWAVTAMVVLGAGPWAVLGALLRGFASGGWGLVAVAVIAPVTEEVMKVAIALWIVEKRPYLFRYRVQILLATLAGGLAFAAIENVMYLWVYIAHPTPLLILVRWTVCVTMHVTCSLIAGYGLVRMWYRTVTDSTRPDVKVAAPWIVAAICIHGCYNAAATFVELSGLVHFQAG